MGFPGQFPLNQSIENIVYDMCFYLLALTATNNDMYQSVAKLAKKVMSISYALIVIHRQDGYIFTSNPRGVLPQNQNHPHMIQYH